jgi:uncharacterized membrane protein
MKFNRGEVFGLILVVAAVLTSAVLYPRLPEAMPSHWNIHGQPDSFVNKPFGPFVGPAIMTGVLLLFLVLPAISPRGFRFDTFRPVWAILEGSIFGLLFLLHALALAQGLGRPVDMNRGAQAGVGLLLIVMGNFMGKVTRNFFVGIRTPWTLASEEVWLRTHRLGGRLFVLAGLVLVVSALLGGASWILAAVAIGAAALLSVLYSYVVYRRIEGFKEQAPGSNSAR